MENVTIPQTPRDNTMAAVKGIAIILMVAGHAEGPGWLTSSVYLFHMPVFFLAAGYFFAEKYLDRPWDFVVRRVKGLYVPFVKWAILFLVLHNLLFHWGILNETYGNVYGGVTHPYTWHSALQRLVHIVFSMAGYDEFMAGAFWFFRALLLSSIIYLVLRLILRAIAPRWATPRRASAVICLLALAFAALKIGYHLHIVTVVQGGIRECWGTFFFSAGCLIRSLGTQPSRTKPLVGRCGNIVLAAIGVAVIVTGTCLHWSGMNLAPRLRDVLTLPLTGITGFLLLRYLCAAWLPLAGWAHAALVHCGLHTLYIYVFHIAAFKAVSALKIWLQGLDWAQMGCHMVIHDGAPADGFWLFYTLAGVALPLAWIWAWRRWSAPLPGWLHHCWPLRR